VPVRKLEPITKAEQKISELARQYREAHPGTTPEKAVIRVLDSNPELYTQYLRDQEFETSHRSLLLLR
jgi:hypothetical protein